MGLVVLFLLLCQAGCWIPGARAEVTGKGTDQALGAGMRIEELQFEAFDCSRPHNLTTVQISPDIACETEDTEVDKEQKEYFVLQKVDYIRFPIFRCSVVRNRMAYQCAKYGHSSLVPSEWKFSESYALSASDCRKAWADGEWGHLKKVHPVHPNATTHYIEAVAGTAYAYHDFFRGRDIACEGGKFRLSGTTEGTYKTSPNMVVYDSMAVELKQETGLMDEDGGVTVYESQKVLPLMNNQQQYFVSQTDTYFWELPAGDDVCPLFYSRTTKGVDILKQSGEIDFQSRDTSMLRLKKKPSISMCGALVFPTEYSKLFLTTEIQHKPFTRKLHPSERDIFTYINHGDAWVYREVIQQVRKDHQDRLARQCQVNRLRKAQQYARKVAEQAAILDGETAHIGQGMFVTAAGEVWHQYRCRRILVTAKTQDGCFASLPVHLRPEDEVRYRNNVGEGIEVGALDQADKEELGEDIISQTNFFMEPRTHRLTTVVVPAVCAPPMMPLYKNRWGKWVAYRGNNQKFALVPTPQELQPSLLEDMKLPPLKELDWEEGGTYDGATCREMERFKQTPRAAAATATTLTQQQRGSPRPGHAYPARGFFRDLPTPQTVSFLDLWRPFWRALERYGQICSIIIASGLLIRFLTWCMGVTLRLFTRPVTNNPCLHVLTAFFPSLRDYLEERKKNGPSCIAVLCRCFLPFDVNRDEPHGYQAGQHMEMPEQAPPYPGGAGDRQQHQGGDQREMRKKMRQEEKLAWSEYQAQRTAEELLKRQERSARPKMELYSFEVDTPAAPSTPLPTRDIQGPLEIAVPVDGAVAPAGTPRPHAPPPPIDPVNHL